jgi:TrkA-N domain/RyR domain
MSLLARLVPGGPSDTAMPVPGEAQRRAESGKLIDGGWSFKSAWRWCAALLADYHWYILAVAGVVAFILGYIGWWRFLPVIYPNRPVNITDAAYWSFKDFLMNSPGQPGLPVELDVARFLAPVVAGWAGLSTLGLLFRDRVQQMRIPLIRGHVVMCGLGKYVGLVFLRHLRDKRIRVVVVEKDAANPNIELCRSLGVPVIVGDAQRLKTLQAAGSRRASRVLAVTDDDAVNTQIVATWRDLPRRRSRPLGCLARIADPDFCSLLRIQEATRGDAEMSADFFNIDEIGARLLLEEFPIDTNHGQPHILVAHLDPLGVWLVYHAARAWCENRGNNTKELMVTVLDEKPDERVKALQGQHPELKKVCDFKPFQATAEDIHERLRAHHLDTVTPHISRAYVTAYGDQKAFETALKLHQELHRVNPSVPIVVALSRPHGMAGLLSDVKKGGALAQVEVFATMERACTIELVRGGSFEPIAELIHQRWREEQIKEHQPAPLWDELDESRKESSRAQARHIAVKLRMVGYGVAPLRDLDAESFKFSDDEVEILAEAEHDRWNRERITDGWTLAPEKNVDRKETPYLVSWPDLLRDYPDIAEWDRVFVREIPKLLASVGLQVISTTAAPTPPGSTRAPAESASDLARG